MLGLTVQFQAQPRLVLVVALLACVWAALLIYALASIRSGRRAAAARAFGAAAGPVLAAVMLVQAASERRRGQLALAGRSAAGAGAAAALTAVLACGVWLAGSSLQGWLLAALTLETVLAVGVFYGNVYEYLGRWRIAGLMALRVAAIAALMAVLFRPAVVLAPPADAARPTLAVLLDRSGSMGVADRGAVSRHRLAAESLGFQAGRIERHFRPVWQCFDAGVTTAADAEALAELAPQAGGEGVTDLAGALLEATAGHEHARLAGVLLLTDGIHNAPADALAAAVRAGVGVYVSAVGSTDADARTVPNVRLLGVEAPTELIRDNQATITIRARIDGLANTACRLTLREEGVAAPLATMDVVAESSGQVVTRELKYTPAGRSIEGEQPDVRRLKLALEPLADEADTADNSSSLHVIVTEPRIRVLYVEGTVRPEFKFLRRLLDSDPNVQFLALVRMGANRFLSQGNIAGSQLEALPATAGELAAFDVIIIGDLDRTFWTGQQLELLKQWVQAGGGLLMLGGHSSFGPGGYGQTSIEDVLPVTLGGRDQPQETTPMVPQLTAEGLRHGVFEGIGGFFGGPGGQKPDESLPPLPELLGCVTVPAAKPGATVLAVHPSRANEAGPLVVLAVWQQGKGRSAAFTADTTSQWHMKLAGMGAKSPYDRFWGQLLRYLANAQTKGRKSRPALLLRTAEPTGMSGQAVRVRGRLVAGEVDLSTVRLSCRATDGKTQLDVPMAFDAASGMFEGSFEPTSSGTFTIAASATDDKGQALASDELALAVTARSAEMERLSRNDELLRQIAHRSGGQYVPDPAQLPELLDKLIERSRLAAPPAPSAPPLPLYNYTVLLGAFVCLMTTEWLLRRRWQLQ